jgi:hypothetical protein
MHTIIGYFELVGELNFTNTRQSSDLRVRKLPDHISMVGILDFLKSPYFCVLYPSIETIQIIVMGFPHSHGSAGFDWALTLWV